MFLLRTRWRGIADKTCDEIQRNNPEVVRSLASFSIHRLFLQYSIQISDYLLWKEDPGGVGGGEVGGRATKFGHRVTNF